MNAVNIIIRKRDGETLNREEIYWFIDQYVENKLPDYQMSAFIMAVYFQGMITEEMAFLTEAMIRTGDTVDLSSIPGIKVDKHSTGGVGDKVSLVLAPLVAAAGITVPMMAGRGLGHTGGTLDKLEAIPGFQSIASQSHFIQQLQDIGCAIIGQSEKIAPADRKMYALRDITGTVSSIPLICSSILSKKKAEGTDALVLDVKVGNGAFLEDPERTRELARTLVRLGNDLGLRTVALLTSMDQPLGNTVGNWNEMMEAVDLLRGAGPDDLNQVTLALGGIMLVLADQAENVKAGMQILQKLIDSGEAYNRFLDMIQAQSGDISFIEHPERMPLVKFQHEVQAQSNGFVTGFNTRQIGLCAMELGAGRFKKEDDIDPIAGIHLFKKIGDPVQMGDILCHIGTNRESQIASVEKQLLDAIEIDPAPKKPQKLILGLVDSDGEKSF